MRKNPLSNMSAHGGIITSEFLENLRNENVQNPRVLPASFVVFGGSGPSNKRELDQQISEAWEELLERWDSISSHYLRMDVSEARSKWIIPLLRGLGFDPVYNKQDIIIEGNDELKFRLSHKGWADVKAPMIHTVAPSQDLEEKPLEETESSRRERRRSPHDELQAYLNLNKYCKWGIVTNGILLRILREFYHTTTKGYVEFDIENIFRERSFTDFRVLYRLAHASRFLQDSEGMCHLEQFYKESVAAGVAVGENLRKNVKKAIEALGNGFLTAELAEKMIENEEFCKSYYAELLRVVYRMLFLLFAEQRAMLPTRDSLYADEYSMNRLREISETRRGKDEHCDLWEGLKVTFGMLKNGCPELKVFGYNGSLFEDEEIPILSSLTCKNSDTIAAVRYLTVIEEERVLKRINYLDLGVEEIGSIYESLLDFTPRVSSREEEVDAEKVPAKTFFLDPRGATRKTTGSYYTDRRLIDELIKSALKSVVEDRLAKSSDKEKALLSVKVCDPACGSGAFLIAATNYMARELAKIRTGQDEPPDKEVRKARRDVLQHCIYGVDLNPMAVELAKVSLWINSCVEDMPLNFLNHHIKCGNSLIGTTPELLSNGIPDEAFTPVEGDDKDFAKRVKKRNSLEREQKLMAEFEVARQAKWATEYAGLNAFLETAPGDVEEKKRKYNLLVGSPEWKSQTFLADAWTAAFFCPLSKDAPQPPTQAMLRIIQNNGDLTVDSKTSAMIKELSHRYRFFHWFLEFPDIFGTRVGGFDCMIGNPPWERIKLQEKEFFEARSPEIASAATAAKRRELIRGLSKSQPKLWRDFLNARRSSELESKFVRFSGRYPFTAKGDINTYAVFAEHAKNSVSQSGLAGIIIPTGIATDDTNKDFFALLIDENILVSLFDFENREGLFPAVHRSYKFSLVTLGRLKQTPATTFAFFLHNPDEFKEKERLFELATKDFSLLNPNTKTCPIFRTKRDAELTMGIYRRVPILVNELTDESPWGVKFLGMFDMSGDSSLFYMKEQLEGKGFRLNGNVFEGNGKKFLPLYESKMFWYFDHRFGTFAGVSGKDFKNGFAKSLTIQEYMDPSLVAQPRYWIRADEFIRKENSNFKWLIAIRKLTNTTNERTAVFTILPLVPCAYSMNGMVLPNISPRMALVLLANLNSIVYDYVARQKLGGTNFAHFIFKQCPVLLPSSYTQEMVDVIAPKVLELTYTAWDLQELARNYGYVDEGGRPKLPFKWDEERRLNLQCELDAIYMLLYGVSREDAAYILEAFPIVKRKDIERFGEYRTKILVLKYFDEYSTKLTVPTLEKVKES